MISYILQRPYTIVTPAHQAFFSAVDHQLADDKRFIRRINSPSVMNLSQAFNEVQQKSLNQFCKDNKLKVDNLLLCQSVTLDDPVDLFISYGIGKYMSKYLDRADIPFIDLSQPGNKRLLLPYAQKETLPDFLIQDLEHFRYQPEFEMPYWKDDSKTEMDWIQMFRNTAA